MRILHVVPTYLPAWRYGGPIRSVHGLCRALARLGHDIHVATTNVDGPGDSDVPLGDAVALDGVQVRYFPCGHLRRIYWSPAMGRFLASEIHSFQVAHLHSIFLWPTQAAARAAGRRGVPYVVAPRGMLVPSLVRRKSRVIKTAWIRLVERRNLEGAALIHCTSRLEAIEASRFGLKLPPSVIVPNGIDLPGPRQPEQALSPKVRRILQGGDYLLFLGRINWKKGLDRLIRCLEYVPRVRLVIAGNDEENYRHVLERLAAEVGAAERVVFAGSVLGPDKAALLERARILVAPSYSENFGNVVVEAMAHGCAVVVTPEVGAAEIVCDAGAGLVVEGDPPFLGAALRDLLSQPWRIRSMGERGRAAVARRFTWEAVARQMEAAYESLCQ